MVFTIALTAVVLAILLYRSLTPSSDSFSSISLKPGLLVGLQLVGVSLWQLSRIRNEEYNVDESTWIANALAVLREPDFFSTLLTHTTARPVTVLPLLLLDQLGLPIDFYSVKVLGLVFVVVALWLTYLAVRNLTNAPFAALALFPLTIFYVTVQFTDFMAYNSELVCNVFIAAAVWLYSLLFHRRDRLWQIGLVGLLLGLIPFAKFQAIPGALIVVGFSLYEWIRQRRYGRAVLFSLAGLLPLVITVVYCLITDQLTVLIRNYFLYYFHYSYQYSNRTLAERFSPRDIIWYYRRQYTFAVYWFGLIGLMVLGAWRSYRSRFRLSAPLLMAALLWAISIYETIQAGTGYEHYQNLVLTPHTLLAALLIYPTFRNQTSQVRPVLIGYLGVALLTTFFSRTKPFNRGYDPPLPYDDQVVALIKRDCKSTDQIAIWGWADRYYVLSGIAPASRYANTVFQMKDNAQQSYYLDQYMLDLQRNKPLMFIDAVAKHQFTYEDPQKYAHERFSAIKKIIAADYQLINEFDGLRVYKLKK